MIDWRDAWEKMGDAVFSVQATRFDGVAYLEQSLVLRELSNMYDKLELKEGKDEKGH